MFLQLWCSVDMIQPLWPLAFRLRKLDFMLLGVSEVACKQCSELHTPTVSHHKLGFVWAVSGVAYKQCTFCLLSTETTSGTLCAAAAMPDPVSMLATNCPR